MRKTFTLTQKIILLLLLPISFEVAFVFLLVYLQNAAEKEARTAFKAHQISDRLNVLMGDFYSLWRCARQTEELRWSAIHVPGALQQNHNAMMQAYRQRLAAVKDDYAALKALTEDEPELRRQIERSSVAVTEAEEILNRIERGVRAGKFTDVMQTLEFDTKRLSSLMKNVLSIESAIVGTHEREVAEQSLERQASLRQQIVQFSIMALGLNVIFSIVIAALLVRGITSRLMAMHENANRLAGNKPLLPPISGTDEIASLDQLFHKMAGDLERNAQMRQEMVNMLTHDMRTPLTAIQGSLEIFESGMAGEINERGTRLLTVLTRNSDRMMLLINDLLDSQKIQSGMMKVEKSQFPVAALFDEVASAFEALLREQSIQLEIGATELQMSGDRAKLNRVMSNLVSNAVKYSPANGKITLCARQADAAIEICVADEGPGIPQEMLATIFERFQQAAAAPRKSDASSGLGLSICKAIIELHGGQIWATSEPGAGSRFFFLIPP